VRVAKKQQAVDASSDGEIELVPSLVPQGRYRVKFSHWSTGIMFGRQGKLALHFTICDQGDYFGNPVVRYYNVRIKGKTGRNGRFSAGWGSDLLREYVSLVGMATRNDRIALSKYAPLLLVAEVGTVDTSRAQEKLQPALHYSVIRKLVAVEAGRRAA
jgi:hypothetical protein